MGSSMRKVVLGLVVLLAMGDSCNNGVVGNQDYGSVAGRVLDATTNKPIADAIVSVGSLFVVTPTRKGDSCFRTCRSDYKPSPRACRAFPPIVVAAGQKDTTAQAGYLRLVPLSKPDAVPTLPPPATPTPQVTIVPTYVPPGAVSPSPSLTPAATPRGSMQPQSGQI